jgi:glycerol uptake facilitator-like aquaporin
MYLFTRALAEFFGTFWLVFGGCGSALFAAAYPQRGSGFGGVALAFGLTVGGRFAARDLLPYIITQVLGGRRTVRRRRRAFRCAPEIWPMAKAMVSRWEENCT